LLTDRLKKWPERCDDPGQFSRVANPHRETCHEDNPEHCREVPQATSQIRGFKRGILYMLRGEISTIPHRKSETIIGNITSTFIVRRGHLRGFVEQSINHQIRWPWRVIDVSLNREVAAGVEITRADGIARVRLVLGRGVL
jgi:hypothetical protein